METIWDFMAEHQKDSKFEQAQEFSPYYEVGRDCVRKEENDRYVISYNGFYRFGDVFERFYDEEDTNPDKTQLFDSLMHYLTQLEFRGGVVEAEIQIRDFWKALEEGQYNESNAKTFASLRKEQKHLVAEYMHRQKLAGSSITCYAAIVSKLISDCVVYSNKLRKKELLVYVQREEEKKVADRLEMLEQLFLPIGFTVRIFWNRHFGVVDASQTMQLNEIEIF